MSQILSMIAFIFIMALGCGLMLFFVLSLPVMTVWKLYRHFKYGEKMME